MSLLTLILVVVLVGLGLYLINQFIPMQEGVKKVLNVSVIILLVLWILKGFGVLGMLDVSI